MAEVSNISICQVAPSERCLLAALLKDDQYFAPILAFLSGKLPQSSLIRKKVEGLIDMYDKDPEDLLWYRGKLCIPRKYVKTILQYAHDSKVGGHLGFAKTVGRLEAFYWPKMSKDAKLYVRGCDFCQKNKASTQLPFSDPQVVQTPIRRWGSLSTDFIVHLPKTKNGFDAITTWVDRLSRRIHLIPSHTSDNALHTAKGFFDTIYRHHGLPDEILSDRDSKFVSRFWTELMRLAGVTLRISSSHHPQTDGSTEVMKKMVENYLRCFTNYHQNDWDEYLISAEVAYNSAILEDHGHSPFFLDLGWEPKQPLDFLSSRAINVRSVEDLQSILRETLFASQAAYRAARARQNAYAMAKVQPPSYLPGDEVLLKKSLFQDYYSRTRPSNKLCAKKFGPFKILELVGKNALRLSIPAQYRIYPVVHVIHTEPYHRQPPDLAQDIPVSSFDPSIYHKDPAHEEEVQAILAHRKCGRGYRFLVQWKNLPLHETSWEPRRNLQDSDGTINEHLLHYLRSRGLE